MENNKFLIISTEYFEKWLRSVKDTTIRRRIVLRIQKLKFGSFGDYKSIQNGIFELRLHFGAGYRIYFTQKGTRLIVLLIGGNKDSQIKDIKKAQEIWQEVKDEIEKL